MQLEEKALGANGTWPTEGSLLEHSAEWKSMESGSGDTEADYTTELAW